MNDSSFIIIEFPPVLYAMMSIAADEDYGSKYSIHGVRISDRSVGGKVIRELVATDARLLLIVSWILDDERDALFTDERRWVIPGRMITRLGDPVSLRGSMSVVEEDGVVESFGPAPAYKLRMPVDLETGVWRLSLQGASAGGNPHDSFPDVDKVRPDLSAKRDEEHTFVAFNPRLYSKLLMAIAAMSDAVRVSDQPSTAVDLRLRGKDQSGWMHALLEDGVTDHYLVSAAVMPVNRYHPTVYDTRIETVLEQFGSSALLTTAAGQGGG